MISGMCVVSQVLSTGPGGGYNEACDLWSLGVILVSVVSELGVNA